MVDIVELLIRFGSEDLDVRIALGIASLTGHMALLERALQAGGDVHVNGFDRHGYHPLAKAAAAGHMHALERLLRVENIDVNNGWRKTALCWAAQKGRLEIVKRLLREPGIDVNKTGPLGHAVRHGHIEIVKCILRVPEFDPNHRLWESAFFSEGACYSVFTMTAQRMHSSSGDVARTVAKMLLADRRIDFEFQLRLCAGLGCAAGVRLLCENSVVNVNTQDFQGDTVLHTVTKQMTKYWHKKVRFGH